MIKVREVLTAVNVDSCLTAVSANFWNLHKCAKTRRRTRFLDLTMKYKVFWNWKITWVCKVLTALWQLYQLINEICTKVQKPEERLVFWLGYEVQSFRKSKNNLSLWGVDSWLTAVSANFWNTANAFVFLDLAMKYKVVGDQKIIKSLPGVNSCLTAVSAIFFNTQKMLKNLRKGSFFGLGYEIQKDI